MEKKSNRGGGGGGGESTVSWNYLPVRLDPACYLDSFKREMLPNIFPGWEPALVEASPMDLGTTNTVLLLQHKQERAVLRINGRGTEKLIDRDREAETVAVVSQAGLCCPLYCQFENGICYGYTPGRPLQLEDVPEDVTAGEGGREGGGKEGPKKGDLARKIAAHMARLHSLQLPTSLKEQEPLLWARYDRWLGGLPSELDRNPLFCLEIGTLDRLKSESRWLQQEIAKTRSAIVFCHSDINKPNVIFDELTSSVTFVDFEYAGPNYLAFDLANWLCETQIELECYPRESYCRHWIALYIEEVEKLRRKKIENEAKSIMTTTQDALLGSKKDTNPDETPTNRAQPARQEKEPPQASPSLELASLHKEVSVFSLASHMLWCVWALRQATHSEVDFDFMKYAILRHSLFVKYREKFVYDTFTRT